MDSIRERRSSLAEVNEERRTRLSEKQSTLSDRREEVDEARIETLNSQLAEARADIESLTDTIETLEKRRDEVQSAIGATEQAIETLEGHRERLETLEERQDRLGTIYEEAETLEETYSDLRSSLRQRNVATLERLVNETFDLLYRNDAYASIELDGDYALTVYQKDGEPIAPERLSGGERALFNLSLRCAIYRLLAEGEHGSAPMPPLILDEPTVYLDDGHVTQLLELVDSMRSLGVEQILAVSHDEELVGAGDRHVLVQKDPTSNRSRIVSDDPVAQLRP
ncbi:MAG: hypothetical protein U5K37_01680 [Natrialbaceae archaeon]|nr:hypothetical protein [Natrialbaceae archaeon]